MASYIEYKSRQLYNMYNMSAAVLGKSGSKIHVYQEKRLAKNVIE